MSGKLCKVWNTKFKKAILANSFEELMFYGSRKLNVANEAIRAFLDDGTEIDEDKIFQCLPAGVVIYLLTAKEKKPWDEDGNEVNDSQCSYSNASVYEFVEVFPEKEKELRDSETWLSSLTIPTSSFSTSLQKDVESGDLSWATKSELLGVICDEIAKHTFFPTVIERDLVARQLVKQFPNLKSNIGEGHEGWSLKIYDRMKNNLKKIDVFSYKRKVDSESAMLKYSSRMKIPRKNLVDFEKENKTVENSKKMMCDEMKKIPSRRDIGAIEFGLKVTSCDRNKLIKSNIPLKDLQKEYPALFTPFGIGFEFRKTYKIDLQKTILMSLHSCSSAVLRYAEKKKKNDLIALLGETDNHINNLLTMTTIMIPEILGENAEFLYKKYPVEYKLHQLEEAPITPHLCVIGDPFFSSEFYIVAENKILIECCDFLEGIATLIGLYFVANIEYPAQAMSTYKFFQSYILRFPCKKIPGKLITFCKSLP